MQAVPKILKKKNMLAEFGYLLIYPDCAVVYNGQVGVRYDKSIIAAQLLKVAEDHGTFGIVDPIKFIKVITSLKKVQKIEMDKENSILKLFYGESSQNVMSIQVALNMADGLPHNHIKWRNFENDKEKGVEISSVFNDVSQIMTNENALMWGDSVGVYGSEDGMSSFDHSLYMHHDVKTSKFFCPLSIMELGLDSVNYLVPEDDCVFLVGDKMQYVCTKVSESPQIKDMVQLEKQFISGDKKSVELDYIADIWKRASIYGSDLLTFVVKDKQIILLGANFKEVIGKTEAPDTSFVIKFSLIKKWVSSTINHAISITEDGVWYFYGETRNGMKFYAVLQALPGFEKVTIGEDPRLQAGEKEIQEMQDIPQNVMLL